MGSHFARVGIEERLKSFHKGWAKSNPTTKKRLLRRLIDCLVLSTEGIKAYYFTYKPEVEKSPLLNSNLVVTGNPLATFRMNVNQLLHDTLVGVELVVRDASNECNGRR